MGNRYSELGRREEALPPTEEAVKIRRELSASNRAFLPDLAGSLGALGSHRLQAGDIQAACQSFQEGLVVLRPAFTAMPQAFLPLAQALLHDYGSCLNTLGQEPDPELMAAFGSAWSS
ncbi:MAG: hypothetical protein ACKO2W_03715 [Vulcanococcus sp.]